MWLVLVHAAQNEENLKLLVDANDANDANYAKCKTSFTLTTPFIKIQTIQS